MSVRAIRRLVVLPRRQMSSSPGSNLAVGDFSAVRVVPCPTTGKALEAADSFIASAELFRFTGTLSSENIGDRSLMVGREAHILSGESTVQCHRPIVNGPTAPYWSGC